MKQYLYLIILITSFALSIVVNAQNKNLSTDYFGEKTPELTALKFAPDFISLPNQYEYGSVFSKNGDEFYFGVDLGGRSEIRYCKRVNGIWSKPESLNFDTLFSYNDPFLSPGQSRLYYISNRALNESGKAKDYDIWYSERKGNSWSEPINAGSVINSEKDEYYVSFAENGNIYYSSNRASTDSTKWNFDIYVSEFKDGAYQEPICLSSQINSPVYEADVCIAPDESYIIFCSAGRKGYGEGDLYISFKENAHWSQAVNMGELINTKGHEFCPFISTDAKYIFFTSNMDIYWISSDIIASIKKDLQP